MDDAELDQVRKWPHGGKAGWGAKRRHADEQARSERPVSSSSRRSRAGEAAAAAAQAAAQARGVPSRRSKWFTERSIAPTGQRGVMLNRIISLQAARRYAILRLKTWTRNREGGGGVVRPRVDHSSTTTSITTTMTHAMLDLRRIGQRKKIHIHAQKHTEKRGRERERENLLTRRQSFTAEARQLVLNQILHPEAADRLGRIRMVKEERATDVENRLIMLAQTGQLRQKVTEEQLKDLLNAVAENNSKKEEKIVINRRKGWEDEDDDDLFDL